MVIFIYDKTFEGLLTSVFDAYFRNRFPDLLLEEKDQKPLFLDEIITIYTEKEKADRVWKGLQKKISSSALSSLTFCWLSELPEIDLSIFRYIRKAIDNSHSIEINFGDPDVLRLSQIWKKVDMERLRVIQFVRFQKTADDIYFANIEPLYNVLPLITEHFKDRFHDQKWIIYDTKRDYGYFYDLSVINEIQINSKQWNPGILSENILSQDEKLFQQLWKEYFRSMVIKERINPKLHKKNLPARFWKFLPEKN